MTSDGYCTINEFAGMVKHHSSSIMGWIKSGKMAMPEDRKMYRGKEVIRANALMEAYNNHMEAVRLEREQKEAKRNAAAQPVKVRKESNYSKGAWGNIKLEPIKVPELMPAADMMPYRQLGWAMLIDAILDLASPCMSDKRNRRPEHQELTISRATRWLQGESDPETLSMACQLAGVSERWIKEKVATIKQFPSRTEMKRMLSEWRASVGQRKQPTVESRLQCYMDFSTPDQDDIALMYQNLPHIEPVSKSRQHKTDSPL